MLSYDWLKIILVCYATSKRPLLSKDTMKNVLQKSTLLSSPVNAKRSVDNKMASAKMILFMNLETFASSNSQDVANFCKKIYGKPLANVIAMLCVDLNENMFTLLHFASS